jgi:hypothetical protein
MSNCQKGGLPGVPKDVGRIRPTYSGGNNTSMLSVENNPLRTPTRKRPSPDDPTQFLEHQEQEIVPSSGPSASPLTPPQAHSLAVYGSNCMHSTFLNPNNAFSIPRCVQEQYSSTCVQS